MDDFQPEDELKPDTSDRPAPRGKKTAPTSKLPISKQHLMIAVGILVLLLLVLGIGSALNSSSPEQKSAGQSTERNIDLSGNDSTSNTTQAESQSGSTLTSEPQVPSTTAMQNDTTDQGSSTPSTGNVESSQPAAVAALPTGPATLDRNAKLSNTTGQQPVIQQPAPIGNSPTRNSNSATHSRPRAEAQRTAPRTVQQMPTERRSQSAHREATKAESQEPRRVPAKQPPVTTITEQPAKKAVAAPATGKGYTLQLSSASRDDTLDAWAKQQKLTSYRIYKTSRNGQPWYVLVSGSYTTPAEAKSAISSLPEAVKAQSPWVKPMSQLH